MRARDKLISLSNMQGCATAAEHFCSITSGGGDIIKRVYENYKIKYISENASIIKYLIPKKINIKYEPVKLIHIKYIETDKSAIKYIASKTIKITHKCKP
ncbi:hypothetical protein [Olleya marilimosa]|uniref:hypothetical protein n=1 Tax=Olleya marilimosa TaxID=272164 RepID=UPI0030EC879D|tara:strand:+ start:1230 stop:1529 length:300 start_codon:yes stop_codon:yes gene_type:complete